MPQIKEQIVSVLDYLPETKQALLLEIACNFLPDDVATPDDIAAIKTAREEYARGETVSEDEIDWD